MTLLLNGNSKEVSREGLELIHVPQATSSYCPIAHAHLSDLLVEKGLEQLEGFELYKSQFGLARNGQQLFGVHTFRNSNQDFSPLSLTYSMYVSVPFSPNW